MRVLADKALVHLGTGIFRSRELTQSAGDRMRSFLVNKNLSFYYWLRKRIGKKGAFKLANLLERVILVFGREQGGGAVKDR